MITTQIADNCLPEDYFNELRDYIVWNRTFPFYFCEQCNSKQTDNTHWYASHIGYDNNSPDGGLYIKLIPFLNSLPDFKALIRIKANFYPQTPEIIEHAPHRDTEFEHKGAIISLNTCDGFTRLEDGTKVNSIANRVLFFNAHQLHNSSTTTNEKGRFNININYL